MLEASSRNICIQRYKSMDHLSGIRAYHIIPALVYAFDGRRSLFPGFRIDRVQFHLSSRSREWVGLGPEARVHRTGGGGRPRRESHMYPVGGPTTGGCEGIWRWTPGLCGQPDGRKSLYRLGEGRPRKRPPVQRMSPPPYSPKRYFRHNLPPYKKLRGTVTRNNHHVTDYSAEFIPYANLTRMHISEVLV
ncbi:hypothetical protein AAG570_000778 [Ranatra chinensis]|uniref:Uncharacterized protein n=1 Tax=Ranatra chinensis TaxID=642074 RepID=A0ABD0YY22_9HEMI